MTQSTHRLTKLSIAIRIALAIFALLVLRNIVTVSIHQWHSGNACPMLGPLPACYLVSVCYAAMAIASIWWQKRLHVLFFFGAAPVIILGLTGTLLELAGRPTCPKSDAGVPLCFYSLAAGLTMLALFVTVLWHEKRHQKLGT